MKNILQISKIIKDCKTEKEISAFLHELFTESELSDLSKRWQILCMLNEGLTQREIAQKLGVSLCKVTRGAKIFKDENSIATKYLRKDTLKK